MSIFYKISPYRFLINRMVKAFARKSNPCGKILELGAGPISYKHLFPQSKVISTDIVWTIGIDDIADVTNLKYGSSEFDMILCFNVLEHVYNANKAVNEMHRVLRVGGKVALIVPFLYPIHDPPLDFYRFTEYSLRKLFSKYSEVRIEPVVVFPFWLFKRFVLFYFLVAKK